MKPQYILILVLLILLPFVTSSQTASVRGTVVNAKNNEAVPFANVVITGTNIGSTTDFNGNFIIAGLEPGFYRITASSVGFEQYTSEEFQLTSARVGFVEIKLKEASIQLSDVIVTAPVFQKRAESPTSMRTIGVSEIEKNPGGNRDISKIVQTLPGVGSTVSFRNDLIVRGGGPNENRFYIDNIEIPNLNHFATQGASGGPVSIINADFLREVDLYSSSFPASKGNALSSVLDMKMLEGNKEKMNTKLTVGASDLGITLNGPTGDNSSLIFSLRRSYLQFLFDIIGLPFLPVYNDFQFKQKFQLSRQKQLTIIGIGALDQSRLNLSANETEEQRYILNYLPETDQWNYTIGASYQVFSDKHIDTYVLSRNMLRNKSFKYEDNDKTKNFLQNYSSDEIENKGRFERLIFVNGNRLNFGIGAEYAKYINNTYQQLFINNTVNEIDYTSFIEIYKGSVFGQYSANLGRLNYTIGLRTDVNSYSEKMSNPLNQISPRFGLTYPLTEKINLNLSSGRFFQLPAYTTLGYKDNNDVLINKQNNLQYISSNHLSAGIELLPNLNSQFTVEGFVKDYNKYPFSVRDSISLANKGGDFGVVGDEEVASTGKGRAYGFEVLARSKEINKYSFVMSYTFVYSEFQNKNGEYIPTAWDQRHLFNVLATRFLPKFWTIGVKWRYAGGSPYTPYDEDLSANVLAWNARGMGYFNFDKFNQLRLPGAHQLDIRIDKEYFFRNFSLNFYLDIQNLYNFQATSPDFLVLETDASGNPIILNPNAPINEQKYALKKLTNTTGTVLPTLGIIIEF